MDNTLNGKKLMFSNRDLVKLTFPIILNSLFAIVTNLVDSVMVSSVGEAAVSAVSLVGNITMMFIILITSATGGGIVVTSQYVGRGDMKDANESAKQFVYLSAFAGLLITTVLFFFRTPILRLVYGSVEADVFKNCQDYLLWLSLGYPFYAIGSSCCAVLRSIGKNTLSVVLTIGANVLNVCGNALFIFVFDMGVAGAAISTTISRIIWTIAGVWILHNKSLKVHFEKFFRYKPDFQVIKKITVIGGSSGIGDALFYFGKLLISSLMATLGTVSIAAYSVANSICNFGWTGLGGFSVALVPIVGQCMGAGLSDQAKLYTRKMIKGSIIMMLVVFGLTFLLRNQLVLIFDFGPETLKAAGYNTGVGALLTILSVYSWAFLPIQAFRAAGDVKYGLFVSIATMFIFRVGLAYLLCGYFKMGLMGIWIGMWADWFARAILNVIHYRQGKWLTKKVI
ncbi:MAG: MATE family efflux transporter [Oscillospiraceae bacterium]|nr:MATE family efflux transporter [Oscillospiraceae bacterium]